MTSEFHFDLRPTMLFFGAGSWRVLPKVLRQHGASVLVITSPGKAGQGSRLDALKDELVGVGARMQVVASVRPNPDLQDLARCGGITGVDVVLGVGGGSAMDAAKVASLGLAQQPGSWDPIHADLDGNGPRLPCVLVPTTAGTGSETSAGAIVSVRKRHWKGGIRGASMVATEAVVDPELTLSMPPQLTAVSGFDIFTHAVESLVSRKATSHSRALSIDAIRVVGRHLPIVLGEPVSMESRSKLAYASTMMGLNLRHVGTALPHRMQYPVGGAFPQVAHAECLAWLYPAWIESVFASSAREDVRASLRCLTGAWVSSAGDARQVTSDWLESIGLECSPPNDMKPSPDELMEAMEGSLVNDPMDDPAEAALRIYREVFG